MSIQKRLFLVGCSRSGTTLLQSLIAAHPDVVSFPESHFFVRLHSTRCWMNEIGLASRKAREVMEAYFQKIGAWKTYQTHSSPIMVRPQSLSKTFVRTFDDLTQERGGRYWLEKTPRHVRYLPEIGDRVPNYHIIHLLRHGEATIASLYNAQNTYPEKWGGTATIEECCRRWEHDVTISLRYYGKKNHTLVTYDDLVNKTKYTLRKIVSNIEMRYDSSMVENYGKVSEDLIDSDEEWKKGIKRDIEGGRKFEKFRKIFSSGNQKMISKRVEPLNAALQKLKVDDDCH
ncbi:sulfotransferase family protein [Salinibacter sp.]|uniref:sulfotransferase family protein n=1 Tax=Salinibacter sp. TaxID=2065818 RepID=UPI0021E9A974|nr:sulfotransferase [Salinibacter sp.]